jgi:hypothetical protein
MPLLKPAVPLNRAPPAHLYRQRGDDAAPMMAALTTFFILDNSPGKPRLSRAAGILSRRAPR